MESFFLNLGLSYTWSKAFPYIIMILLGLVIGIFLFRKSKSKITKIVSVILIGAPFGIYFAISPIYEGDFSNNYTLVDRSEGTKELQDSKLYVVSTPGCPYCKESIGIFRELQEKNPQLNVEYIVTVPDSIPLDNTWLEYYTELAKGDFPVRFADDRNGILKLATDENGVARFPTFVLVEKNKDAALKTWNNNNFGVMAIDDVVNSLH